MTDSTQIITSYATKADDGRIFVVYNFANEDFHAAVRDEEGFYRLGRFDTLAAAQAHVERLLTTRLHG